MDLSKLPLLVHNCVTLDSAHFLTNGNPIYTDLDSEFFHAKYTPEYSIPNIPEEIIIKKVVEKNRITIKQKKQKRKTYKNNFKKHSFSKQFMASRTNKY